MEPEVAEAITELVEAVEESSPEVVEYEEPTPADIAATQEAYVAGQVAIIEAEAEAAVAVVEAQAKAESESVTTAITAALAPVMAELDALRAQVAAKQEPTIIVAPEAEAVEVDSDPGNEEGEETSFTLIGDTQPDMTPPEDEAPKSGGKGLARWWSPQSARKISRK